MSELHLPWKVQRTDKPPLVDFRNNQILMYPTTWSIVNANGGMVPGLFALVMHHPHGYRPESWDMFKLDDMEALCKSINTLSSENS